MSELLLLLYPVTAWPLAVNISNKLSPIPLVCPVIETFFKLLMMEYLWGALIF
jgi:hypothetical protein